MFNFPQITNLKREFQPKNMIKNISHDNSSHNYFNSFIFDKKSYKKNINLKIFDSPLRTKNNIAIGDLININSSKNKNNNKTSNIIYNYQNHLPLKKKINISLSKHSIQEIKLPNEFKKNMKKNNDEICGYNRPRGTIKKTNPKFYLPKLVNLSTNLGRNTNLSMDKEFHEKKSENMSEENLIDEKLNNDKEPIFLEKKIKYNNMKNIRLNIKSPGDRNKLRKYIVNLNKILAINKY